jgi:Flp pilus assembly protein TadG
MGTSTQTGDRDQAIVNARSRGRLSSIASRARSESGMSYVFVGMGLMAFLSASMLAIDVGMLMTARNQAQNAADAGALGGATALFYDDFNDRTADGPAVTSAIAAAQANLVMPRPNKTGKVESGVVDITPADVEFLNDAMGEPTRVKVTVRRNAQGGNAIATLIAGVFGVDDVGVSATATAEASPANAMTCVKPFTIPDRWIENQTPPWDPDDTFDIVDKKNKPLADPDVYIPITDATNYSGYNAARDKGLLVVLKADNDSKISPSIYYPWAPPDSGGGSDYRWNIANCNQTIMPFGAMLTPEPGNMVGPTKQGMDDLIAKDPDAYWDTSANDVVSQKHPSPRVVIIPLFDPDFYENGKQTGRNADLRAVNYLGFFIERMQGNEVVGRVTPVGGLRKGSGYGAAPTGAFPKSIRLVQ